MTTNQQADPLIGRLVDGRYRVRARIARGGMATVYVATDLRLERRIALKVMHAHLSDDSAFQSRFIQEARAAARLADPHVVNVFDQGQDGELAYLVMEYLPGITLRELMREQRRLTIPQTITIMDAVLAGLAAAHRAGIVHRDVKPENVLLAEDGRIKIGDFGLARATTANTATGAQLLGTIAYLAPELVTRGTADARSDIYALGIMLYEMLVGEQPYKGEQPMQIAFQHATESVPRPSIRNASVPEQLDELVLWATERSPQDRPDDAQAMLDRLREIERDLGIAPQVAAATAPPARSTLDSGDVTKILPGTIAGPTTEPVAVTAAVDNATLLRRRASKRRARGAFLLAFVLLLATLAGGVGWWFGSGPGSLVAVPDVRGTDFATAQEMLSEQELVAVEAHENSIEVDAGQTIRTDPEPGERLDKGAEVTVFISDGPAAHTLDALAGKTEDEVRTILSDARINIGENEEYFSSRTAAGSVINVKVTPRAGGDLHECAEGCEVFEDDSAVIQVSLGAVPDVTGDSVSEATAALEAVRLTVNSEATKQYNDDIAKDAVIGIADRAEKGSWRPGEEVTLIVSLGPKPIAIPDVVGWTIRDAVAELEGLGFEVNAGIDDLELPFGGGYWDIYRVRGVDPDDEALPGATITLTPGL
ncbi:Stk1 family PASTA domain-containing Ser/Thr kinase [Microbacterium sp. NPDC055903]